MLTSALQIPIFTILPYQIRLSVIGGCYSSASSTITWTIQRLNRFSSRKIGITHQGAGFTEASGLAAQAPQPRQPSPPRRSDAPSSDPCAADASHTDAASHPALPTQRQ